jgi:hypothetical protein
MAPWTCNVRGAGQACDDTYSKPNEHQALCRYDHPMRTRVGVVVVVVVVKLTVGKKPLCACTWHGKQRASVRATLLHTQGHPVFY